MKPLRLSARNLRTWQDLDLELPDGIAAVVGPNGAGKSSLVNVIDLALFGTGRELKRALTRGGPDDTVEVDHVFEHAGEVYRVRRSYQAKGAGKSRLDLEQRGTGWELDDPAPAWVSLTRETIAETQGALEALLGLSRLTFRASAFIAQGDGAAFTQADPRDRKAILLEALGVRVWDHLLVAAGSLRREAEVELTASLTTVELQAGQLATIGPARARVGVALQTQEPIALAIADLERGLAERRGELEAALEAQGERVALVERLKSARERVQVADMARRGIVENMNGTAGQAEQAQRDRLGAELEAREEALNIAADQVADQLAHAEQEIAKAERGEAVCPTCEQALAGEAREKALTALRGRRNTLEAEQGQLTGEAAAVDVRLRGLREEGVAALAETQRRRAEGEATLREHDALRLTRTAEVAAAEQALERYIGPDVEGLRAKVAAAEGAIAERRRNLTAADAEVERARAEVDRLAGVEAEHALESARLERHKEDAALYKLAEQAFGRDGVPALLLEAHAIPQLEAEANRIIGELGRSYRFELRTQRETQAGTVKEALDVVVATESGEALYEDFSGGERTRLDLALRISLARLIAARRGSDVRCLVIDEPAFLDADGFAQLAGVLRGLQEFEAVLVVSHEEALRDAFDTAIAVTGGGDTNEPSRLEEAT